MLKKIFVFTLFTLVFMSCFACTCTAVDTTVQSTTTVATDYNELVLNHLDSIDTHVQNCFNWIFATCFCIILLLLLLVIIIICRLFVKLIS